MATTAQDSTYSERFANNLKRIREKAGLSVADVVGELEKGGIKIEKTNYYRFEKNTRIPNMDIMPAIAKALKLKYTRELFPKD